jgi:hypothetical protein
MMGNPWELTDEERKDMTHKTSLTAWTTLPAKERTYVGDPVPCPRCGRWVCIPGSTRPCQACQIKALETEVERLREELATLSEAVDLRLLATENGELKKRLAEHGITY